jgi:hypothetical protein
MIEINLLPEELRKKESVKIVLPEIPVQKALVPAVLVFLGLQILFNLFSFYKRGELVWVERELTSFKKNNADILGLKDQIRGVRSSLQAAEAVLQRKFFWTSFLNALSSSMTKGIWFRNLSLSEDSKVLALEGSVIGKGQETAYIGRCLKECKDNAFFKGIFEDIEVTNIVEKKVKEFDVYDFLLHCRFKKEMLT